jgi:hypothetical protein
MVDGRANLRDVRLLLDFMIGNVHRVEDRFDDADAVALRLARRHAGLLLEQADHHADRQGILHRDAADGIDGVEEAGLLDQQQSALAGLGEPGADRDAFVFLANADQARMASRGQRPKQALAGGDIGYGSDELDAARFDFPDEAVAGQPGGVHARRCSCARWHSFPSPITLNRNTGKARDAKTLRRPASAFRGVTASGCR